MSDQTPAEVSIDRQALTVLRSVLIAAQPREGCALLVGDGSAVATVPLRIRLIWPCLNAWQPACERTRRFRLDSREQLLAQRWARQRRLRVLGAAHSHPRSAAVPSPTDLELVMPPTLQLILSPLEGWAPACWWLELGAEGRARPRPLRWRMGD